MQMHFDWFQWLKDVYGFISYYNVQNFLRGLILDYHLRKAFKCNSATILDLNT